MTLQVTRNKLPDPDLEEKVPGTVEPGVTSFIHEAFDHKMPKLIPFVLQSESLRKLATHLKRHSPSGTGSPRTLYQYTIGVRRFTQWIGKSPDEIIAECFNRRGEPVPRILNALAQQLDDFAGVLQDQGLASGTINNHVKGMKQLFRVNGARIELLYPLSKHVKFKDRSPTPEELQRLIDLGDPRDRAIISGLALGGFRVGTLALLEYRHVKKDLEKGVLPVHVHVEAELVKGHYGDYDTFLQEEAVGYLRVYFDQRRAGDVTRVGSSRADRKAAPEKITDDSPLIRSDHSNRVVKRISPQRIHDIVHELYIKAGLLQNSGQTRYELRAHSLRKYFRTQLAALGVINDYIDYMMGHVVDTYHDIQMKGPEHLRGVYAASALGIRPKTQQSKLENLKDIARGLGFDPEKLFVKEAQAFPRRSYVSPVERQAAEYEALARELRAAIKKDLLNQQ